MSLPPLTEVGSFGKPHGIKGEISATLNVDGIDIEEGDFVFATLDGLDVPFRVTAVRYKGSGYLLSLKDIDSDSDAKFLSNRPLLMADIETADDSDPDSEQVYLEDLIDYTLTDGGAYVGKIADYYEPTADNPLFVVTLPDGEEIFIPASDELIADINFDTQTIDMTLPEGLVDLNN